MTKFLILFVVLLIDHFELSLQACTPMWEADLTDPKVTICPGN